jgi:hypothetical protein
VILLRRFLVLAALLFWQGGFTFYSSVAVPTGFQVLGSHAAQARITVHVARWLNLAGAIALALLLWDTLACRDGVLWRRRVRLLLWAGMLLALLALFALHPWLAARFDSDTGVVDTASGFRAGHVAYLDISAAQWFCGLGFLALSLAAWREEDRLESEETKKVPPLTTSASPSHRSSPAAEQDELYITEDENARQVSKKSRKIL